MSAPIVCDSCGHPRNTKAKRATWSEYFLQIAAQVATRATCDRAHVGCVLVNERTIIATGYNGSLAGAAHCDDVGHLMHEGHCVRTLHAEANAIAQAAKDGRRVAGATAYITHYPCLNCFRLLAGAGVWAVVYLAAYNPDPLVAQMALEVGVKLLAAPGGFT